MHTKNVLRFKWLPASPSFFFGRSEPFIFVAPSLWSWAVLTWSGLGSSHNSSGLAHSPTSVLCSFAKKKGTDYTSCERFFSLLSSTSSTNNKMPRHMVQQSTKIKNHLYVTFLEDFNGSYLPLLEKWRGKISWEVTWQNLCRMTIQKKHTWGRRKNTAP
jgi:hypothetical protein